MGPGQREPSDRRLIRPMRRLTVGALARDRVIGRPPLLLLARLDNRKSKTAIALQRFVARDSPADHAATCAAVPIHITVRLVFAFSFLFSSPVFQQLLFIFPDLNFLLSTIYFSREILLTNTLEKNLIQIISSIVLRICMMKLYSYNL